MIQRGLALALAGLFSMCLAQDQLSCAKRISAESIGIDTHIDTLQRVLNENIDIGRRLADGQVDLPRLKEGGCALLSFPCGSPATHSSCRALSDIPRNMSDDMLQALGKNGGVVFINLGSGF